MKKDCLCRRFSEYVPALRRRRGFLKRRMKEALKIAIIHPEFREGGGSEAGPLWTAEALKKDYAVTIITMGELDFARFNRAYGTDIHNDEIRLIEIPIPPFFRKRFDAFRGYRLARYCRRVAKDYDLMVSTYNVMDFGVRGLQFIADFSFSDSLRRSFDGFKSGINGVFYKDSVLRRIYLYLASALAGTTGEGWKKNITIANSDWSGRIVKNVFGIETRTIYPPVFGSFPDVPWEDRKDGFVCIGRLVPEKRIDRMIEIMRRVRERRPGVSLHIVGSSGNSQYMEKLNKLAAKNSSWLFMEGGKFGKDKLDFLARHKYGIHGHPGEAFGIAVAEMVKAGCLTFVPVTGGPAEIVGHEALLYSDVDDAVQKIERVLANNSFSEELRACLAKQGEKFSVERFKDEIRGCVRVLLNTAGCKCGIFGRR
jgi:glycosyltransferase involved in cell wall biosynthesis